MKILVTGGFGFLGSHLIELLLDDDSALVHVVDNLSTSPLPLEYLLKELGHPKRLTHTIGDMAPYCLETDEKFDEIYHLASVVGPAGVLQHAGTIAKSIVDDTMAVVDLAEKCDAKLLDISTSEIYGGGRDGHCREDMARLIPPNVSARLEYVVGKLAGETALINRSRTRNLDARIVRPFNITGPRQSGKGGFVLPRFVGQALAGKDITVFGDGSQVRAFTHVIDMAQGIIDAMRNGVAGEAYNVGNPENRGSIQQLAEEVREIAGSKSQITHVDPKTIYGPMYEEANDKYPDATRAIEELDWKPTRNRRKVIGDVVNYLRDLPDELRSDVVAI